MRGTLFIGLCLCFASDAFGQSGWRVDVVAAVGNVAGLQGFSAVVPNNAPRLNGGGARIGPATIIQGTGPVQLGSVSIQHYSTGMRLQLTSRPLEAEVQTPAIGYSYGPAGPLAPFTLNIDDRVGGKNGRARLLITPVP